LNEAYDWFFRTGNGRIPTEEFLDTLSDKVVRKIIAVIELLETERVDAVKFFKKLVATENGNAESGESPIYTGCFASLIETDKW
jgi:hypothetical protein